MISERRHEKRIFFKCSKCEKRLIERKRNGLWYFVFGRSYGAGNAFIPVEIFIHGNLKMRCLRRSCRKAYPTHWNVFNFFPNQEESEAVDQQSKT